MKYSEEFQSKYEKDCPDVEDSPDLDEGSALEERLALDISKNDRTLSGYLQDYSLPLTVMGLGLACHTVDSKLGTFVCSMGMLLYGFNSYKINSHRA